MVERLIFTALVAGIELLQADLKKLEFFFVEHLCLTVAEAAKVRTYFTANPPSVVHNYPRQDSSFPLYAVVLGNEKQKTKFLDDTAGFITAEEAELLQQLSLQGTEVKSSIYDHQHHIIVYTEHPDVTIWYYEIAKYLITRELDRFKTEGLLDIGLAGQDMAPESGYAPEWLFVRRLTMSSQREQQVFDERQPRIRTVDGIHVDDGVHSPSDLGGARSNVTTFDPDEEES